MTFIPYSVHKLKWIGLKYLWTCLKCVRLTPMCWLQGRQTILVWNVSQPSHHSIIMLEHGTGSVKYTHHTCMLHLFLLILNHLSIPLTTEILNGHLDLTSLNSCKWPLHTRKRRKDTVRAVPCLVHAKVSFHPRNQLFAPFFAPAWHSCMGWPAACLVTTPSQSPRSNQANLVSD